MISKLKKKIFSNKSVVAVVKLKGVIGKVGYNQGLTIDSLKHVEQIKKIKNLNAIILLINSPGGSPVQSELISKKLTNIAQDKKVPIYSFCEDVAASGGYWLACMGEEIYASDSSIIGSIGVISQGFGFTDAIKKIGIERRIHTQGENKSVLDPFSKEKKEDIELIKNIQKDIHDSFIQHVKKQRNNKLNHEENLFTGKFWSGKQALKLGLIDRIGFYEDIIKEKYGDKVNYKFIEAKQGFLQKKISASCANIVQNIYGNLRELLHEEKYKI
jgi:signal peptide peptidase SppA